MSRLTWRTPAPQARWTLRLVRLIRWGLGLWLLWLLWMSTKHETGLFTGLFLLLLWLRVELLADS